MFVMKARRDAIMEAKEYKMVAGRRKRRSKKEKLIDESNWRFEIVKVNEAFQVCRYYTFLMTRYFKPMTGRDLGHVTT